MSPFDCKINTFNISRKHEKNAEFALINSVNIFQTEISDLIYKPNLGLQEA